MFASILSKYPGTLFSTGGDELNTNCYVNDTIFQDALMAANETFYGALNTYVLGTHDTVRAYGKTPVVWEGESVIRIIRTKTIEKVSVEMLLMDYVELGNDTLIMLAIT